MHMFKSRVLSVVVGAAVVIGAANLTAYAANGHPLLLGQHNSAGKTTSLAKSGKGPALSLHTKKKSPPFAVNSSKKVKHLNASMVGGKTAAQLQTNLRQFKVPGNQAVPFDLKLQGVPAGRYLATLDIGLTTANPDPAICYLGDATTTIQVIGYGASSGSGFAAVSAAGLFTVHSGKQPILTCNTATATVDPSDFVSSVTLVPVSRVTPGTLTASRTAPRHSALGR